MVVSNIERFPPSRIDYPMKKPHSKQNHANQWIVTYYHERRTVKCLGSKF